MKTPRLRIGMGLSHMGFCPWRGTPVRSRKRSALLAGIFPPSFPRTLLTFFSLLATCFSHSDASALDEAQATVIRQRVRADYISNPRNVEEVLEAPLTRTVNVASHDTLSGLISRIYRVGETNAPEAYKLLASFIVKTNGLPNSDSLRKGMTLVVPDLPPLAKTEPNPSNPFNAVPKMSVTPRVAEFSMTEKSARLVRQRSESAEKNVPVVSGDLRVGAQEVIQLRLRTLEEAKELTAMAPSLYEVDRAPLELALEQGDKGLDSEFPVLTERERELLESLLAKPPLRPSLMIIVDDSWPSDEAFREARDFLVSAIESIREYYKMGKPVFSRQLLAAKDTRLVEPPGPSETHGTLIKRSLAPLQALELAVRRVKVVYLPLLRSQEHAQELLGHLIAINLMVKSMGSRLRDPVPPDVKNLATEQGVRYAGLTSSRLDSKLLKTDHAVLEAVLMFAYLYSEVVKQPFFMNMSWVVPNMHFQPFMPSDAYGLHIVAAGNEGDTVGTTVYDLKRQFACRSLLPGDMLAVMNLQPDGSPHCNSSLLSLRPEVLGLGFNGSLAGTPCGGTSFAAPRVAWLLAAREAYKPRSSQDPTWQWGLDLRSELRSMRQLANIGFGQLQLDISQLFSSLSTP